MKNRVTKPFLTGGGTLKFDLQRFAIVTPTRGTSWKDGSEIEVTFQDDFGNCNAIFTYNVASNSFSESHSGWFIEAARAYIQNGNIVIQFDDFNEDFSDDDEINTITLDTANNKWTLSKGDTYNTSNYSFNFNDTSISYDSNNTFSSNISDILYGYTIEIGGNTYPVEFDSNGNLSKVNGTALDSNGKVTLDGTTYTFSGTKDSITYEEFTDIIKTKTIDGVEVTFTFDGSNNLTNAEGDGVTYSDGKFTIGNKTYSATLANDTVNETLESATYTKTVNDVEVTFNYNGSGVLQSVTGDGVSYSNGKITVGGKTYTVTLKNDDVTVEEVNANSHLFENDNDAVKILATPQEDTITNSGDNVTINAQSGKDTITNSGANVSIYGGAGDDTIENTGGNVTINAGAGNDSVTNGGENVSIYGSFGDDTIENTAQSVTVNGYCGNDSINNNGASVSIYGGIGNDTIINSGSNVTINGGIGADYITNDGDNVSISLAAGNDTIENTGANVLIYGGSGKNKIVNNGGAATILGGSGNEEITGGSQADSLVGNLGNDTLFGGAGNDTLTGGSGRDLFIFESGNDIITDYESNDKIQISSGTISETSFDGNDVIFNIGNGTLTVQNGKGKKIKFIDSSGNTTTQTYTESNVSARTLDILYDNNFMTDDTVLDSITEQKYTVTEIQSTETDELNQPVISYSDEK